MRKERGERREERGKREEWNPFSPPTVALISTRTYIPVLSEHRIDMPAISSMAARRETIAPSLDISLEPRASVVVVTIY